MTMTSNSYTVHLLKTFKYIFRKCVRRYYIYSFNLKENFVCLCFYFIILDVLYLNTAFPGVKNLSINCTIV